MKASKLYVSDDSYIILAKSVSGQYFVKVRYCDGYYGAVWTPWKECQIADIKRVNLEWDDVDGNHHKAKKVHIYYNTEGSKCPYTMSLSEITPEKNSRVRLPY